MTVGPPLSQIELESMSIPTFYKRSEDPSTAEETFYKDFIQGNNETEQLFIQVNQKAQSAMDIQITKRINSPECKFDFPFLIDKKSI